MQIDNAWQEPAFQHAVLRTPCPHSTHSWQVRFGQEVRVCHRCNMILAVKDPVSVSQASPDGSTAVHKIISAPEFLSQAQKHMQDRAATYDRPEGERSMQATVDMFNTLKGTTLSATDGWEFMVLLKLVRANQGAFKSDNYEDLVAYAALAGEEAARQSADKP